MKRKATYEKEFLNDQIQFPILNIKNNFNINPDSSLPIYYFLFFITLTFTHVWSSFSQSYYHWRQKYFYLLSDPSAESFFLGVGKSFLKYRFLADTFGHPKGYRRIPAYYHPHFTKLFDLKGKELSLQIWDLVKKISIEHYLITSEFTRTVSQPGYLSLQKGSGSPLGVWYHEVWLGVLNWNLTIWIGENPLRI